MAIVKITTVRTTLHTLERGEPLRGGGRGAGPGAPAPRLVFWTYSREAYIGLGEMYVADPRFTAIYDRHAPGAERHLA